MLRNPTPLITVFNEFILFLRSVERVYTEERGFRELKFQIETEKIEVLI